MSDNTVIFSVTRLPSLGAFRGVAYGLIGIAGLLFVWWVGGRMVANAPGMYAFSHFAPEPALTRLWGMILSGEVIDMSIPSLYRVGLGLVFAILIGVPLGFLAAYREGTFTDIALMMVAIAGISMPHFWLGLMLLFFFALELGWLPVSGNGWLNLILPALTLGLSNAAIFARLTRSSMIDVMSQDYVQTAFAKGLPKALVLRRHVLRAGLLPVVTMMGLQFAFMMGGAIVVENIFSWNGVGRMAVEAIFQRDYPIIQGFILTFSVVVVFVAIAIDALYAVLDPRIRRS